MALRMARPIKRGTSANWLLKSRVPGDLVDKAKGHVVLPINGMRVPVAISGGYVEVSLRTSDPDIAVQRHAEATSALQLHWQALRNGPQPLSKRQAVALSAEVYRERVGEIEHLSMVNERETMNAGFNRFVDTFVESDPDNKNEVIAIWLETLIAE